MGSVPFFFFFFLKKSGGGGRKKEGEKKKSVPELLKRGALVGFLTARGNVDVRK